MVAVPGGRFVMGSDLHYPEERPQRWAEVAAFRMDRGPVTVAAFARFVAATRHVTAAERAGGSACFRPLPPGAPVADGSWWAFVPGASWRDGAAGHPVVHVGWDDAVAYAAWAGKALPTEAEWERAARGGRAGEYAWGHEWMPGGVAQANTWQGRFPHECLGAGEPTAVGAYPANGFGLLDMIGNVWEWTADPWAGQRAACCAPPGAGIRRVMKGGSFLCAPSYCARYRPAARQGQEAAGTTGHIGFRCVMRSS